MLAHLYNVILYSFHSREQVPNELLQLVSRRHSISSATQDMNDLTTMRPHLLTLNGMLKLQEDIVSRYLAGRPRIANISSIHIPFVFRASKPTSEGHPLKYVYCSNLFDQFLLPLQLNCKVSPTVLYFISFAQDLNQVGKLLPPSLKVKHNVTFAEHVTAKLLILQCMGCFSAHRCTMCPHVQESNLVHLLEFKRHWKSDCLSNVLLSQYLK